MSLAAAALLLLGGCASTSSEERVRASFHTFRDAYLGGNADAVWACLSTGVRGRAQAFRRDLPELPPDDPVLDDLIAYRGHTREELLGMDPAEVWRAVIEAAPIPFTRWLESPGDLEIRVEGGRRSPPRKKGDPPEGRSPLNSLGVRRPSPRHPHRTVSTSLSK